MAYRLLLLFLLTGFLAGAQFPYHPLQKQAIAPGLLRTKKITRLFVFEEGEPATLRHFAEFNSAGLLITEGEKQADGADTNLVSAVYYTYNAKHQLTRLVRYEAEEDLRIVTTIQYNSSGRRIRKQSAEIDPPTYTYTYEPDGKLSSVLVTQRMPDERERAVDVRTYAYRYRYDGKGRISEEWQYALREDPKMQTPSGKMIWAYDEKGRVASLQRVREDGSEDWKETYSWSAEGLIQSATITRDDVTTVYRYEYR